jgi:glucose/arabinose dehydrogenase
MRPPFLITILLTLALFISPAIQPAYAESGLSNIKLPTGFKIEIYADAHTKGGESLSGARFMAFDTNGRLYVTSAKNNKVLLLPDTNQDGVADEVVTLADNLNAPQGLTFLGDALLVANQNGVVKLEKKTAFGANDGLPVKVTSFISHLPAGGHALKNIKLSPDGYLFINVGSSCNVCNEADATRASILRYTVQGKPAGALVTLGRHPQSAVWASGLRNSQGFAWHPKTGAMYATNNGADMRSSTKGGDIDDELPPEHLNKIVAGKHYGWPHCWAEPDLNVQVTGSKAQIMDPNFPAEADFCKATQAPEITFISHSTPIGITFLDKTNFPVDYKQDAIVALHGSWNRKQPAGYKIVRVKFKKNEVSEVEDFATGWLTGHYAWGRPVDVIVGADGALYISDDKAGAIYRIRYQSK